LLVKTSLTIGKCRLLFVNCDILFVVLKLTGGKFINSKGRCLVGEIYMLYDKILVPIDGSEHSIRALGEATKVAKITGGIITLVYVSPACSTGPSLVMPQLSQLPCADNKTVLVEASKIAQTEDVKAETLMLQGDAAEQIVKTAKECNFDLIVIGARGLSKISGLILGSVSQGVVKSAPCPVLVIR
jgi:nucleotide-binding universal stress UspA family protein